MNENYFLIIQIYFIIILILVCSVTYYLTAKFVKQAKKDMFKYVECVLRTNKERGIPLDSANVCIPNPEKIITKKKKSRFYHFKKDPIAEMEGKFDDVFD